MSLSTNTSTRVLIFLPLTFETMLRVNRYIRLIRNYCGGLTWSRIGIPSPFYGWGKNPKQEWEKDETCVLIFDINPMELIKTKKIDVIKFLERLYAVMRENFKPQKIWMTMHTVDVLFVE